MSAFTSRTSGYKAGVILLFIAGIAYIVGYASPYWASTELSSLTGNFGSFQLKTEYHEGIWTVCVSAKAGSISRSECTTYGVRGFPAWFHVVRVLECVGVVGVIVGCIYALATNCCRSVPGPRSRFLEVLSAVTGLLAFIGCMVYVGFRNKKTEGDDTISQQLDIRFGLTDWTFNWAFYLTAIGSALVVVAGIIIGVGNKQVEPAATIHTGGTTIAMATVQSQQTVTNPYVAQPQVQPYGAQPMPVKAGYPAYPSY